jgi:hypothetical protein
MKLHRLVEMISEDYAGAEGWPVWFASYIERPTGEWEETDVREAVTTVQVDVPAKEVLVIRDPTRPPLTLSSLHRMLSELTACHGEFDVDTCEPPIEVDGFEGGGFRIDLPIVGAGRDEQTSSSAATSWCLRRPEARGTKKATTRRAARNTGSEGLRVQLLPSVTRIR